MDAHRVQALADIVWNSGQSSDLFRTSGDSAIWPEKFVEIRGRLQVKQVVAVGGEIRVIERLDLRGRVGQSIPAIPFV